MSTDTTALRALDILIVAESVPSVPDQGYAIRAHHLLLGLARQHRVTLVAYGNGTAPAQDEPMRMAGIEVHEVPPPRSGSLRARKLRSMGSMRSFGGSQRGDPHFKRQVDDLVAARYFDVVQVETFQMLAVRPATAAPVVLDELNIEYELRERITRRQRAPWKRLFNTVDAVKVRREERQAWRDSAGCLVTSHREAVIVRRAAPSTPVAVIPNGVDVEQFHPEEREPEPMELVFVGLMDYRPNTDAVAYFVRDILPRIRRRHPRARFTVVGKNVPDDLRRLEGNGVHFTGRVRDVRPYVASAACLVVPLRMGAGTRLKVLEGMASGKAMVSTSVGCEGIDVVPNEHLLVADDAASFADAVCRLLDDRALGRTLGRRARLLAEEMYDWRVIVPALEAFHAGIARRRS